MNNTERLIGKMNDELAAFVAGLERLPVQDVIEKAGEIAVKTDMALLVEEAFLAQRKQRRFWACACRWNICIRSI